MIFSGSGCAGQGHRKLGESRGLDFKARSEGVRRTQGNSIDDRLLNFTTTVMIQSKTSNRFHKSSVESQTPPTGEACYTK